MSAGRAAGYDRPVALGRSLVGSVVLALAGCSLAVDVPAVMEGRRPEDERRKQIEIAAPITADQTDLPVAIIIPEDPDLVARANPRNLAFFDDGGTLLPHELEKLDPDTGELISWVRVPLVLAGAPTRLYMHYGGPDREPFDSGEVWSSGIYAAVWHLDTPGATQRDSTAAHRLAAVTSAGQPVGGDGSDDGSLEFSGSEVLELTDPQGGELDFQTGSFGYSVWVRLDVAPVGSGFPLRKGGVPDTSAGYAIHLNPVDWEAAVSDGIDQRELGFGNPLGAWTMLGVIVDRDPPEGDPSVCAYTNGETNEHAGVVDVGSVSNDQSLVIGLDFVGHLDEVRIYSTAVTKDRLLFEYRNFAATPDLLTFGGEEEL